MLQFFPVHLKIMKKSKKITNPEILMRSRTRIGLKHLIDEDRVSLCNEKAIKDLIEYSLRERNLIYLRAGQKLALTLTVCKPSIACLTASQFYCRADLTPMRLSPQLIRIYQDL